MPVKRPDRVRASGVVVDIGVADDRCVGGCQFCSAGGTRENRTIQTWEQIYAGWQSTKYQNYWKSLPLNIVKPDAPLKTGY